MPMRALMSSVCKRASSTLKRTERHAEHRSATDRVVRLQVTRLHPQSTSAASAVNSTKSSAGGSIDSSKDTLAEAATGNAAQSTASSTTSQKTPRHTVSMLLKALNEMGLVACTGLVRSDSLDDIRKLKAEVCAIGYVRSQYILIFNN